MHEFGRHVLIALPPLFGVDLSITNDVMLVWLAALITFCVLFFACRSIRLVPHGMYQNAVEAVVEFVEKDVIMETLGEHHARNWGTFILTLFFFILFSNLLGLVPDPTHFRAATGNINVTAALAIMVLLVTIATNIHANGFWGFLRKFAPAGIPKPILLLIIPIEIIGMLARPFSLAIRLFANMTAGHALILMLIGLEVSVFILFSPLPFVGAVIMEAFEIFVCFIQAFIFVSLTSLYLRDALDGSH